VSKDLELTCTRASHSVGDESWLPFGESVSQSLLSAGPDCLGPSSCTGLGSKDSSCHGFGGSTLSDCRDRSSRLCRPLGDCSRLRPSPTTARDGSDKEGEEGSEEDCEEHFCL